jgi:hypothetical protein
VCANPSSLCVPAHPTRQHTRTPVYPSQPHSHPRGLCSCRDYPTVEGYLARASDAHLIGPSGKDCSALVWTALLFNTLPCRVDDKGPPTETTRLTRTYVPTRTTSRHGVANSSWPLARLLVSMLPRSPTPLRIVRHGAGVGQCKLNEAPRPTTSRCACALIVGLIASSATSLRVTRATGGWPRGGQFKLALRLPFALIVLLSFAILLRSAPHTSPLQASPEADHL